MLDKKKIHELANAIYFKKVYFITQNELLIGHDLWNLNYDRFSARTDC